MAPSLRATAKSHATSHATAHQGAMVKQVLRTVQSRPGHGGRHLPDEGDHDGAGLGAHARQATEHPAVALSPLAHLGNGESSILGGRAHGGVRAHHWWPPHCWANACSGHVWSAVLPPAGDHASAGHRGPAAPAESISARGAAQHSERRVCDGPLDSALSLCWSPITAAQPASTFPPAPPAPPTAHTADHPHCRPPIPILPTTLSAPLKSLTDLLADLLADSGVFLEKLFKTVKLTLWLQSIQLSVFALPVGSRKWGVGSRKWGVGSRQWGVGSRQ